MEGVPLQRELEEASMVVYLRSCPNCGGPISDSRLSSGLPCASCLPRDLLHSGKSIYELMRELGTLERYERLEEWDEAFQELSELFERAVGNKPWGIQRLWLRRLSRGSSFAMLAPTGVGKTTLGTLASIYFAMKGGKSYILVPTTLLVRQIGKLLEFYASKLGLSLSILVIHSGIGSRERAEREERLEKGEFDILVTTSRYLMQNFQRMQNLRFRYLFVDDVDAVMRGSKVIEMILRLMGFSERAVSLGSELLRARRELAYRGPDEKLLSRLAELKQELERETGGIRSVLVISSATGNPGARARLFRELLGFEVGARPELVRNVYDLYVLPKQDMEREVLELVRSLGRGGLVFVPVDRGTEYANALAEFLKSSGIEAEAVHSKKAEALEKFASGEVEVLVGVATYYGILVRGLDLPERIRYAIFVGVPRHKVGLQLEELDVPDVLRLLPLLAEVVEEEQARNLLESSLVRLRRALRRAGPAVVEHLREVMRGTREPQNPLEKSFSQLIARIQELVGEEELRQKLTALPEVAVREEDGRMYLLIPDAPTYLQASGRTSRLYLGGISRGISIVLVDDPRLLKGLERRISWMVEDFSFSELERGKLSGMIEEVDRDRELVRLVRAGLLSKEELERQRGLEFKTSLLVVESPNKARTIANFFGTPSVKEYGRLRVYEVSLGNQTILITATGGHVYELVTGPPLKLGDWRDLFGVAARDGRYVPLYTSIRRCPRCLQQFTGVGEEKACPYCGSSFLTDSLEVVEAIREVAREVDEILVGTDPDTEGEKIAYDLLNALKPLNPNVRRVEFHEVTKRALLGALAGPRGVNVDLVKAQLVRRVEDRWIGFSLSKLLQEGFGNKNLSAGRVQTPVLGWVIEAAWKWRRTKKRYLSATVGDLEFVFELPRELAGIGFGAVERMEVEIYGKEREEIKLGPHPPFTTDAALSELSSSLRIPVSRIMEILQDLFEAGFITYHRTDSTRISEAGMRVAEEYLRQMGWEELLVRRSWGEGGAHEAIRPTRPLDSPTLRRLIEEEILEPAVRLGREHFLVYDAIFRRFMASQMEQAEVSMEKIRYKGILYLRNGRVFELEATPLSLCVGIRKEGFLKCERRIRVRASPELGRYPVGRVRFFYRSEQLPHTEASLVRRMRETGIGRPSTYSKIVETILKRGYVARSGDGYLFPRPVGIEIHRFLTGRFQNLVSEERTRELEEKMDMVERGEKDYSEVLSDLHSDLFELGLVR